MLKPVIVIGAGGHGKVVADALLSAKRKVIGFTDATSAEKEPLICGLPVLGDDEILDGYTGSEIEVANGIGFVGVGSRRKDVYFRITTSGFQVVRVIHPSAVISKFVELSAGVQLMAGTIVQAGTVVGENSILNTGCRVEHDCTIKAHCHIAPGAVIAGDVVIGEHTLVGAGAVIVPSMKIGRGAVIGAGAVVLSDVQDHTQVYGVPAKPKKELS